MESIHPQPEQVTRPTHTAAEMRRRIGIKYGRTSGAVVVPEHLVVFEVAARDLSSPWRGARRIDAVAVGLLKRTDYLIHGFEIKVSRADLRQELREPEKAATGSQYCDRWWLALSDASLLRETDEIPSGWGVIAARGRGLHVVRQPQKIERVESPVFRAALLHACQRSPSYRFGMGFQAGLQRGQAVGQAKIDAAYQRGAVAGRWAAVRDQGATA